MAQPLSTASPRRAHARTFSLELRRAMRRRRVGKRSLAAAAGVSVSAIGTYRRGDNLPTAVVAARVAEALEWPDLARIVASARGGTCPICTKTFVNESGGPKIYCSEGCREVAQKRRGGRSTRIVAVRAERRLAEHMRAVEAFCRSCEPLGICRTSDCELRAVSPLPLALDARPIDLAVPPPGRWGQRSNGAR